MYNPFTIEKRVKDLQSQVDNQRRSLQEQDEEISELKKINADFQLDIAALTPLPVDPLVPVFSLTSVGVDPLKGVQVELDWNDAFIQYIKDTSGDSNSNAPDEYFAERFLVMLYQDLIDRLEGKLIDIKSQAQTGDYE
jgi:hypothetical protein